MITDIDAAIVATFEPSMRVRTTAIFTASPPRAGSTAFSATPSA